MNSTTTAPPPGPRQSGSYFALVLVLLLVGGAGGYYLYVSRTEGNVQAADTLGSLKPLVTELARSRVLDACYQDADGDLVADPPAANKLRDPAIIRFVGIPGDYAEDPAKGQAVWKDFLDHLAKATGKTVVFVDEIKTPEAQLRALRDGTLDVTAFTTGQVTGAVNTAGFVPVVCPADEQGNYAYEMEILTRKDSPISSPSLLKGRTIAFSAMSSNSGSRAPMVVLQNEFQLLPGRDYQFLFTGDQMKSIQGLASGQYEAICVANDFYRRMVADPANTLDANAFRSIYKSKPFPPLCFGVAHDLAPPLREKLETAMATFSIAGSSVSQKLRESKFAPVKYKLDWSFVREVDDAFCRLPEAK